MELWGLKINEMTKESQKKRRYFGVVIYLHLFLDLRGETSRQGVGQIVKVFDFAGHTVLIVITQFCCGGTKSPIVNLYTNKTNKTGSKKTKWQARFSSWTRAC